MDHCMMQGVEAIDRIVQNIPECTLPSPHLVNAAKQPEPAIRHRIKKA
jgi:hypothetical protein